MRVTTLFDLSLILTYLAACIALIVVPGPSVTVIISTALKSGVRAGLANVAGTQFGLLIVVVALAFGLEFVLRELGAVFFYMKFVGAAYLIYLGYKMLRSDGSLGESAAVSTRSLASCFWQGFFVMMSNPKVFFFFGAFIPQFVDVSRPPFLQTLCLGLIFMAVAIVFDGLYAVLAGRAGAVLTRTRVQFLERVSGVCLIGGGFWLAASRRMGNV